MDTQGLKAFLAVAEQHSFSAAGEQLHLTQSAVSKRIQQLEQQLNTLLFDRHNRTVSLTEAGFALLPKARQILDLVAEALVLAERLQLPVTQLIDLVGPWCALVRCPWRQVHSQATGIGCGQQRYLQLTEHLLDCRTYITSSPRRARFAPPRDYLKALRRAISQSLNDGFFQPPAHGRLCSAVRHVVEIQTRHGEFHILQVSIEPSFNALLEKLTRSSRLVAESVQDSIECHLVGLKLICFQLVKKLDFDLWPRRFGAR